MAIKTTRIFSDIDLRFTAHPVSGDIIPREDVNAIKDSVRNLVLTNFYERKFNPEIGSQVNSLLFETYTPFLDVLIKRAISDTILNYEPRVQLIDITVISAPDNNSLYIKIEFVVVNTQTPQILNLTLERTR